MKKILVVMIAFVLGMAITSCKQSPKAVDAADAADPAKTLIEIVEKAKAEGANWTVEEWKEVFTTAMKSIAPTGFRSLRATMDLDMNNRGKPFKNFTKSKTTNKKDS